MVLEIEVASGGKNVCLYSPPKGSLVVPRGPHATPSF